MNLTRWIKQQWRRLFPRESNLVSYARRELALAGAGDSLYGDMLPKAVLEIVACFAEQGHSGMSASVVCSMLEKLLRFEPLTPLTGDDDEWNEVGEGYFQNRRCSHVFKEDGQAYDGEGRIFRQPDGGCYTNAASSVNITFPYVPKRVYVDVAEDGTPK